MKDTISVYLTWVSLTVIVITASYGWIMNILILFSMENVVSVEGIFRIIGVFLVPLGSVMGFL